MLLPVCAEAESNTLLRASYDGFHEGERPDGTRIRIIGEIKVPSPSGMAEVRDLREQSHAYRRYVPQVQHQFRVSDIAGFTGVTQAYLFFYDPENPEGSVLFEIERDQAMIDEIEDRAQAFWNHVDRRKEPNKDPERDILVPEGLTRRRWLMLADEYRQLAEQAASLSHLKERMDTIKEQLETLLGEFATGETGGVRVSRYLQRGGIDWQQAFKDLLPAVDEAMLEKYRKPDASRVRLTPTKGLDVALGFFQAEDEAHREETIREVSGGFFW
jgi:hypothetical protein